MNRAAQALRVVEALEKEYPGAICSLEYQKPHELLIATRLSAQCTDARVNVVTKTLFQKYRTLEDFARAELSELEGIIHSCGFYKTKARDIQKACQILLESYGGVLPDTIEELVKLPGVGRKTANLVAGDIYGKPAIVCDTHCIRITNLIGLTTSKNPLLVEKQLRELIPPEKGNDFCHRLVLHGRAACKARAPRCGACGLASDCDHALALSAGEAK